jgi:hypothetical protein
MPRFDDSDLLDEQVPLGKYWSSLPNFEKSRQHIA